MGTRRVMLPGALRATPLVCSVALVAVAVVTLAAQQLAPEPVFRRPIVERIQPGQPYLLLQRILTGHPVEFGDKSFVAALVESQSGHLHRPGYPQRTGVHRNLGVWHGRAAGGGDLDRLTSDGAH